MGKADLHVHSRRSDGMASPSQIMHYVETQTDRDRVAIADHDHVLARWRPWSGARAVHTFACRRSSPPD